MAIAIEGAALSSAGIGLGITGAGWKTGGGTGAGAFGYCGRGTLGALWLPKIGGGVVVGCDVETGCNCSVC